MSTLLHIHRLRSGNSLNSNHIFPYWHSANDVIHIYILSPFITDRGPPCGFCYQLWLRLGRFAQHTESEQSPGPPSLGTRGSHVCSTRCREVTVSKWRGWNAASEVPTPCIWVTSRLTVCAHMYILYILLFSRYTLVTSHLVYCDVKEPATDFYSWYWESSVVRRGTREIKSELGGLLFSQLVG